MKTLAGRDRGYDGGSVTQWPLEVDGMLRNRAARVTAQVDSNRIELQVVDCQPPQLNGRFGEVAMTAQGR